jgi:hypothetical protein
LDETFITNDYGGSFSKVEVNEYKSRDLTSKRKTIVIGFRGKSAGTRRRSDKQKTLDTMTNAKATNKIAASEKQIEELKKILHATRASLAKELEINPYHVVSGASLEDMAREQPITIQELFSIKGLGKGKVKTIGLAIITVIREFRAKHFGDCEPMTDKDIRDAEEELGKIVTRNNHPSPAKQSAPQPILVQNDKPKSTLVIKSASGAIKRPISIVQPQIRNELAFKDDEVIDIDNEPSSPGETQDYSNLLDDDDDLDLDAVVNNIEQNRYGKSRKVDESQDPHETIEEDDGYGEYDYGDYDDVNS